MSRQTSARDVAVGFRVKGYWVKGLKVYYLGIIGLCRQCPESALQTTRIAFLPRDIQKKMSTPTRTVWMVDRVTRKAVQKDCSGNDLHC